MGMTIHNGEAENGMRKYHPLPVVGFQGGFSRSEKRDRFVT